jgi:predicted outer membrane repeat protein
MRTLIYIVLFLSLSAAGFAQTMWNVPGDFATIQEAMDDASVLEGDTILVAPGTYFENVNFGGKDVTLKSSHGPAATVIDGSGVSSVVAFTGSNGFDSVLDGFTITNGLGNNPYTGHGGGGVLCPQGSCPTITNNIITKNTAVGSGGGIYTARDCVVTITRNIISENTADRGGALNGFNFGCNLTIKGNVMRKNTVTNYGGAIHFGKYTTATIENNMILENQAGVNGGGISATQCTMTVTNNTIAKNRVVDPDGKGGGVYTHLQNGTTLTHNTIVDNLCTYGGGVHNYQFAITIKDSIIWGNSGINVHYQATEPIIEYSDVEDGWPGTGNIDQDPLLVPGPQGLYYPSQVASGQAEDSPCVDSGSDLASILYMNTMWTRTDGVTDSGTVDMGFHYGYFCEDWTVALHPDTHVMPASTGGTVNFTLTAGVENAHRKYILIGGVSGTIPGKMLPGGYVILPINFDWFSQYVMTYLNTVIFTNFLGTLDSEGNSWAQLNLPTLLPTVVGLKMNFAYACNNPFDFVSNAVAIEIID